MPHNIPSEQQQIQVRQLFGLQVRPPRQTLHPVLQRLERLIDCAFDQTACDSGGSTMEPFESPENQQENYGDLFWAEGWANNHYDIPFVLLAQALRTNHAEAWNLGFRHANHRARYGWCRQHVPNAIAGGESFTSQQITQFWDNAPYRQDNYGGQLFEKGNPRGNQDPPRPSHHWLGGLMALAAVTNDPDARQAMFASLEFLIQEDNQTISNKPGVNLEPRPANAHPGFYTDLPQRKAEPRTLGWPVLALAQAYKLLGWPELLARADYFADLLVETEFQCGSRGYWIGPDLANNVAVKPWMHGLYTATGLIELQQISFRQDVHELLLRMADWLSTLIAGNPKTTWYAWHPETITDRDRSNLYAFMCLPPLVYAAKKRRDGRFDQLIRDIARDTAYYRDAPPDLMPAADFSNASPIRWDSLKYSGSRPKVYGQTCLTLLLNEQSVLSYLHELMQQPGLPLLPILDVPVNQFQLNQLLNGGEVEPDVIIQLSPEQINQLTAAGRANVNLFRQT